MPLQLFEAKAAQTPLFYLEYFPPFKTEFPDAIEHVVSARGGTILKIHSPGDLAQAIQKLKGKLRGQPANADLDWEHARQ